MIKILEIKRYQQNKSKTKKNNVIFKKSTLKKHKSNKCILKSPLNLVKLRYEFSHQTYINKSLFIHKGSSTQLLELKALPTKTFPNLQ
jgi:hypothetical protein